jgi:hypothetical protein
VAGQATLEDGLDPRLGGKVHLVHNGARHGHAVLLEERGVQDDLVDRSSHAALAHDHRGRAQQARHDRVREPDHRADPGVARPLDEHELLRVGEDRVRAPDPGPEVLDDLAGDVCLREAARNVDRAHDVVRVGEAEDRLHEHGVLVRRDPALVGDGALADGLREAGPEALLDEGVDKAERGRRLPAILARGGEVQVAHTAAARRDGYGRVGTVANGLARIASAISANAARSTKARRRFRRATPGDGRGGLPDRDRGRGRDARWPRRRLIRAGWSSARRARSPP